MSRLASVAQQTQPVADSGRDCGIALLDGHGCVQAWSGAAESLHGYTADEVTGWRLDAFHGIEARAAGLPERMLREAAARGYAVGEGWRLRKDGTQFWANIVLTAVRAEDGRVTGYTELTRALTQGNLAETHERHRRERLWHSEERFRLLVEGVEEYAIFMLDPQGVVATWNVGAERINGYRAHEIIGKHFSIFRLAEEVNAGACERELADAIRDGKLAEEGWRVRKDGSRFWASVVLTALRDPTGALVGFAKITRDLSQRRLLDEERVQRARAEEAVRLREEFLLIASHELKTPLASLHIDLHGLLNHPGEVDKQRHRLERARRNVERLNELIESLLSVSRLSHGKLALRCAPMDLGEALARVVDTMSEQAKRAGCTLELRLEAEAVTGSWDRLRIEQVVMNLLANAVKYGAAAPIMVTLARADGTAVITVRDHGPGIAVADRQRIFGRFERASSIRHFGGLGLGLYIAREIVAAHGGTITADNHPEGGAELTVRLPLPAAAEEGRDAARS